MLAQQVFCQLSDLTALSSGLFYLFVLFLFFFNTVSWGLVMGLIRRKCSFSWTPYFRVPWLQLKMEFFHFTCTLLPGSVNNCYTRKVAMLPISFPTLPQHNLGTLCLSEGSLTPTLFPELYCPSNTIKLFPTTWVRNRTSLLGDESGFLCIHPRCFVQGLMLWMRYFSVWDFHQVVVLNFFCVFGVRV